MKRTLSYLFISLSACFLTASSSFAYTCVCNSLSECTSCVQQHRNDEGENPGAVCFTTADMIPRDGMPTSCKASFKCGSDTRIIGRAYFKNLGYYQKWTSEGAGNTSAGRQFRSCFGHDGSGSECVEYAQWALKPESASIFSQLGIFMGIKSGETPFSSKMNDFSWSPSGFCKNGKGSGNFYWNFKARRNHLSKDYVTHVVGNQLVTEREELTDEKNAARGEFKLTK